MKKKKEEKEEIRKEGGVLPANLQTCTESEKKVR